jgi:transcriptional regulator with XRE-family HTH domain
VPEFGDVIAANVRGERAKRRWTQEQLATRLGWERARVGHLESGRRTVKASDLPALCRALDVPFSELIRGAEKDDLDALGL